MTAPNKAAATISAPGSDEPLAPHGVVDVEATFAAGGDTQTWQPRPPAEVASEIAARYPMGDGRVKFVDDGFLGPTDESVEWVDELASELMWRTPGLSFSICAHLDGTLLAAVPSLRAAGLVQVRTTVEAVDADSERDVVTEALHGIGVEIVPSLVAFEPDSSPAQLLAIVDWIERYRFEAWFIPTVLVGAYRTGGGRGSEDVSVPEANLLPRASENLFGHEAVARAYRAALAFDEKVVAAGVNLAALVRRRRARDADLLCVPLNDDPLLLRLVEHRQAQLGVVREVVTGKK